MKENISSLTKQEREELLERTMETVGNLIRAVKEMNDVIPDKAKIKFAKKTQADRAIFDALLHNKPMDYYAAKRFITLIKELLESYKPEGTN